MAVFSKPLFVGGIAGLCAVLSWGGSFALAKQGTAQGLLGIDFVLLRFGVAGILSIPLLAFAWREARAIGVVKGCAITFVAGPLFVLIGFSGFAYAPLAHGAIIQPSTVVIGGMLLATTLFGEALTPKKLLGAATIVAGIVLVGGSGIAAGNISAWKGDLLFATAGCMWLTFTIYVRRWTIDPIAGTAIVNVLAAIVVLPISALRSDWARLLALSPLQLTLQAVLQGVFAGVLATVGFAFAVRKLGVSRAAMLPAMVPAATMLIGAAFTDEHPSPYQIVGLCITTIGLLIVLLPATAFAAARSPGD